MKVLKGILFTLLAIVVIAVIAFVVVINLTPRQLGLQGLEISGETIEDMGLADLKIKDIYKSINNLSKVKEEDIVQNSYDDTEQKGKAKDNFGGSSLSDKDDYSSLVGEKPLMTSNILFHTMTKPLPISSTISFKTARNRVRRR